MNYKLMLILVLAFFTTVFIFQNSAEMHVSFLIWSVHISQVLLMAIIFAVGILIGALLSSLFHFRKRRTSKEHAIEDQAVSDPARAEQAVTEERLPADDVPAVNSPPQGSSQTEKQR